MKVGVIGAGRWGRNIVRTLYRMNALAAVAEPDLSARLSLSEEYSEITLYTDYRALLESDVPAVAIATPAPTHFEVARCAILAGKDVFVEKPMTLSTEEAQELVELARARGRILMVGHLLLYQPAITYIKSAIDSGLVGEIYSLHQERLNLGRARATENSLWSLGVHDVAIILYLTGQEPIGLNVVGQCSVQSGIEDDVYLHLEFATGIKAHLHVSWLWPERRRQLTIVGSRGMLSFDEESQRVVFHDKGINPDLTNRNEGAHIVFEGATEPLQRELQHFIDCIETRTAPLSDGESGLKVVSILERAGALLKQ